MSVTVRLNWMPLPAVTGCKIASVLKPATAVAVIAVLVVPFQCGLPPGVPFHRLLKVLKDASPRIASFLLRLSPTLAVT